jgi:CBS domain-containing protein
MKFAGDILEGKNAEMIAVDAGQSVLETLRIMVEKNIGAILVREGDRIAGIWTEKDYVRNSLQAGFDSRTARIGDYMVATLHTTPYDTPIPKLQEMYLGLYTRYVMIEKEGQYVGLLSIGDVLRANLLAKDREIKDLNAMASWEYYENWGWDPKKKT